MTGICRSLQLRRAKQRLGPLQVVVNYARSSEAADQVAEEIRASGGDAIVVGGDVSKADDVAALIKAVRCTTKGLRIVDSLQGGAHRWTSALRNQLGWARWQVAMVSNEMLWFMKIGGERRGCLVSSTTDGRMTSL
jgi:NAD(P)-dependent dehydrogenase (short-subunit alcohol dehydrogenase family)